MFFCSWEKLPEISGKNAMRAYGCKNQERCLRQLAIGFNIAIVLSPNTAVFRIIRKNVDPSGDFAVYCNAESVYFPALPRRLSYAYDAQILPARKRPRNLLIPAVFKERAFGYILAAPVVALAGVQETQGPASPRAGFKPFAGAAFRVFIPDVPDGGADIIQIRACG